MEKEFVNYEQALKLKELGFDEPCLDKYDPRFKKLSSNMETWSNEHYPETLMIPAPLYQQAFRWFREKYDICPSIEQTPQKRMYDFRWGAWGYTAKTYEEGELACLDRLIEIVKKGY